MIVYFTMVVVHYFENNTIEKIENGYIYIANFIKEELIKRREIDSKIIDSVIFKSKDFYPSLKNAFNNKLNDEIDIVNEYKL